MKNEQLREWVCGCGETNTEDVCSKCGEPKGNRQDYAICEKCHTVYFSEEHICSQ